MHNIKDQSTLSEKSLKYQLQVGEIEIYESGIIKFIIDQDLEINDEAIDELSETIESSGIGQYSILLDIKTPFIYSDETIEKLNQDPKLVAVALLMENKEKLDRSKFMLEMGSLLPNPFSIPVKPFKREKCARDWLYRIMNK
jgi:hypothetical protein